MSRIFARVFSLALVLLASLAPAHADTRYEPYFQSINRCVGGYLAQSGMTCLYAFAVCEGVGSNGPETRDVRMTMSCRINADGTCPAAFECARDGAFTHINGGTDALPRACSRTTRNVECRWGTMLQR